MILTCADLPAFHAGELDDLHAEAMRRHIGGCKHCERELQQLILEEIVTHPSGRPLPPDRQTPAAIAFLQDRLKMRTGLFVGLTTAVGGMKRRMKRRALGGLALALSGAAALVVFVKSRQPDPRPIVNLAAFLAPTRSTEVRIGGADRYRPYDVKREGPVAGERIEFELLGALEASGEWDKLFAAVMLAGDTGRAAMELERLPPGADRDSDRAALDLARDRPDAALGHAARALEKAPRHGRALWNAAVARKRLKLPLAAAALFDRVARLGEPGWSDEAKRAASYLRATRTAQLERSRRARTEATRLERERVPMSLDLAQSYPDVAREALVKALCGASPAEAELLVPMADAVDAEQGTSSLGAQARAAARDTRARPPLASEYARLAAAAKPADAAAWRALAVTAGRAGFKDIEVGALFRAADVDPARAVADLHAAARASRDPWLLSWAAREVAWYNLYSARNYAAAESALVEGIRECPADRAPDTCAMLQALLAVCMATQGRYDQARTHIEDARKLAAEVQNDKIDARLLHLAAEIAVVRDPEAADPVALAAAYAEEFSLQDPGCTYELRHLDYVALAALDMGRFEDGRRFSDQTEAVRRERCQLEEPRLNGSLARARVLQRGASDDDIARLRADLEFLRTANETVGGRAYADHIEGRLLVERRREEGEALLQRAIAAAAEVPDQAMAVEARQMSLIVLALDAGRRGDYRGARDRLAEADGRPAANCTLSVAGQDGAVVVVATDRDGTVTGNHRVDGRIPSIEETVPDRLAAALVPCDVVDVMAIGAYYGRARLLPRHLSWRYRSAAGGEKREALPGSRLVVTGVEPPVRLKLPALSDEVDEAGATVVRGGAATPKRVLARMADAAVVEIHAHGLVDAQEPNLASLALSPDADGDYALTADRVRGAKLTRNPLVLLAACDAARTPRGGPRWGLADAFLAAGARSVVASTTAMPDAGLAATLSAVTKDVRNGLSAAQAVRDVRLKHPERDWLNDIVVFE